MSQERERPGRPILVNGEYYVKGVKKPGFGRAPELPRTYEQAVELLNNELTSTEQEFRALPAAKKVDSVVFCLRMNPKFIAKSYTPTALLKEAKLPQVGSRRWTYKVKSQHATELVHSKLLFVRSPADGLAELRNLLSRKQSSLTDGWKEDACKIDHISLLTPEEQLLGFEDWTGGRVEVVLHSMDQETESAKTKLLAALTGVGVNVARVRSATYGKGLNFLSIEMKKEQLDVLKNYNPLRTAHPLNSWTFPNLRNLSKSPAPKPNPSSVHSSVKVGIFDGGSDATIPLLLGHVGTTDLVNSDANPDYVAHGTAVAGAALYGPLNDFPANEPVPAPAVSVESFRILPLDNPEGIDEPLDGDDDPYGLIDQIEKTVNARDDIKVYNLSFGPPGPIIDDAISRFTLALDNLAYNRKVLFTVAVGNDGYKPNCRVQAPSDLVNGLGIGAWTFKIHGKKVERVRAGYSCVGPGREGCKVKPDLVAFGGCDQHPFLLVGSDPNTIVGDQGTSYSAPVVAGRAAELIGRSDRMSAVMARTLVVHSASHPEKKADLHLGFGFLADSVDKILNDGDDSVTVLYQGPLRSGSFAKIPLPYTPALGLQGKVQYRWTIGVLAKPDPDNADEYTSMAIEDYFYPNSQMFSYAKVVNGRPKISRLDLRIPQAQKEEKRLLADDWKKSKWPMTDSVKFLRAPELERRAEFKWDTIVSKIKPKTLSKVFDPFIVLHALGRNDHDADTDIPFYAVAATISVPRFKGDLQAEVLKCFPQLQPLQIRTLNEIMVKV